MKRILIASLFIVSSLSAFAQALWVYYAGVGQITIAGVVGSNPQVRPVAQVIVQSTQNNILLSYGGSFRFIAPAQFLNTWGTAWGVTTTTGVGAFKATAVSGGGTTTDASLLTTGTLPEARIPASIARTSAVASVSVVAETAINAASGAQTAVATNAATAVAAEASRAYVDSLRNTVTIDVAKIYGVVADGGTDQAAKLMKIQADLSGPSKPAYILIFPAGTVASSNNRWYYNIAHLDVYGPVNRTTFRTIYSGGDEKFQRPFFAGDIWQNNTLSYVGTVTYTNSHEFLSVSAGSRTLTLKYPLQASIYSAGKRILLDGYDIVGNGYPPGTKNHEWHEIESVNTSTGVITLKEAIQQDWDQNWWDILNLLDVGKHSGKPRITLLDRPEYIYPRHLGFHNVNFGAPIGGPTGASGSCQPIGQDVVLENVDVEGHFWLSETQTARVKNLRCFGDPAMFHSEFDKVGGSALIEDSYFRNYVSNGVGFESLTFDRCQFDESAGLCPRNLTIRNSTLRGNAYPDVFTAPLSNAPTGSPIRTLTIQNLTFNKTPANQSDNAIDLQRTFDYTVTNVSGNNIVVPFTSSTQASAIEFVFRLEKGLTRLYKIDGSKVGTVLNVVKDSTFNSGQGAYVVSGRWNAAPAVGEVWRFCNVAKVIDLGGHRNLGNFNPFRREGSIMSAGNTLYGTMGRTVLHIEDIAKNGAEKVINLGGRIASIEAVVSKAHNGTDTQADLYILNSTSGDILKLNTKIVGRRYVTEAAAQGTKMGDNQVTAQLGIWQATIKLIYKGPGGVNLADQSAGAWPELEIIITTF